MEDHGTIPAMTEDVEKESSPSKPGPGDSGARPITRAEAKLTGLPWHTVLMVYPTMDLVTFWERRENGKLVSLIMNFDQNHRARGKLEDYWTWSQKPRHASIG